MVFSIVELPATVVIARISKCGFLMAIRSARASSMPGSVSIITFCLAA